MGKRYRFKPQDLIQLFAPGDRLMSVSTACGERITLFVAGSRNGAVTLDISRSLDETEFQQLPAATEVLTQALPQTRQHLRVSLQEKMSYQ